MFALNQQPIAIKRRLPGLGPNPDYSRAFYPDPPSHDFCVWLIIAELMRRYHGCQEPLHVKFGLIDGMLGKLDFGPLSPWSGRAYQCGVSREYYETMLSGIMRPAMEMIGAIEEEPFHIDKPFNPDQLAGWVEYDYHIGHLVDAAKQGHDVPKWQVPEWAFQEVDAYLSGFKPVVLTLRETTAQPERNSRIGEWLKFADHIQGDHPVLFVRDTAHAHEHLPPFLTYRRASENAYVRAALYQRALVNMMVGNGPSVWCIFSDAPFVFFKQLVPELPTWAHGQPEGWREQDHMEVGEQLPWAGKHQRFAWADDTFENILREFEAYPWK